MRTKVLVISIFLFAAGLAFVLGWWWRGKINFANNSTSQSLVEKIIPKPLEAYTINSLSKSSYPKGKLEYNKSAIKDDETALIIPKYNSSIYNFTFQPNPTTKDLKTTSVLINEPLNKDTNTKHPLVLMLRGYVDPSIYTSGIGTKRASEVFVENGYITIAPDFLGYGQSDQNSADIFESRFQTYTTVLALLSTIDTQTLPNWDGKNIFIWAHSNGGQIALTTLEITGKNIPTTLWAPVSKPFPYSILYYTDESQDRGKLIRHELANFEDLYDTDNYSLDLYLEKISAPILLHQGTADDAVPVEWSNELVKKLEGFDKDITYYTYPGSDHNLQPAWNTVVSRDLMFFAKHLQ